MPAARARLIGGETVAPRSFGPIGHHHGMGRARDGILGNIEMGRKDAADKIDVSARRADDGDDRAERHQRMHIRPQRANLRFTANNDQRVSAFMP
jgi:hypothetical protein